MKEAEKAGFEEREQRLTRALGLASQDRVLFAPFSEHFFSSLQAGLSHAEGMSDHDGRMAAMKGSVLRYGFDLAPASGMYPSQLYQALEATYFKWPGGGLPESRPFQFVEKEYMAAEEYDDFLADPSGFTLGRLWPRMAGSLKAFGDLPSLMSLGPDPIFLGGFFMTEEALTALEAIAELGREYRAWQDADGRYAAEMKDLGYPLAYAANFTPPFDLVADYLRGLRGMMLDMYRHPDKLMAAVDVYVQPQIKAAIEWAAYADNPRVVFWLHRGAAGFMSNEQYERFYWPSLWTIVLALVEAGLTPILHVQGDYTPRLPFLAEFPEGKVPIHYDRIDRQEVKRTMGRRQCYWGNVSAALLATGKREHVVDDVRELIDLFGPFGGLIIDGNLGIPDEARPENIAAMREAVDKYGSG